MPFNTITVAAASTPTIINTAISHYLDRKPFKNTPKEHLSYHEGLALVRRFLEYSSYHTVEQVQSFTAQYVPHPTWVHCEDAVIPNEYLDKAAEHIVNELGTGGVEKVGGGKWWLWRDEKELEVEWIEMRKDWKHRLKHPEERPRTMFYIHGGAYFFGSIDEHRYQLQRHARKLKARVFAPKYRLAPQYPFPCGLHDALAAYLYLLTIQPADTIIVAGDSAGGGMILSLLVILRDQGIDMPAGGVLISPWVDLCHSFPSVIGDNSDDYIPAHGFLQKPSLAWPPPPTDPTQPSTANHSSANPKNLQVTVDGKLITIRDQIQMYTPNAILSHPLVSPVTQSTLGGLPPLLIITGGGEVLRDEQIYIAHKAADPAAYPTWEGHINEDETGRQRENVEKYKEGTKVLLQVYDGCCHVATTLASTKPAKLMFKSVADFGKRCFAEAAGGVIDEHSESSYSSSASLSEEDGERSAETEEEKYPHTIQSTTYATLPPFPSNNIIRQRITSHGTILKLPSTKELDGCQLPKEEIGVIKAEPVKRWMEGKDAWDKKFSKARKEVDKARAQMKESESVGEDEYAGERPPPSALVARRRKEGAEEAVKKWWKEPKIRKMAREEKSATGTVQSDRRQSGTKGAEVVDEKINGTTTITAPSASPSPEQPEKNVDDGKEVEIKQSEISVTTTSTPTPTPTPEIEKEKSVPNDSHTNQPAPTASPPPPPAANASAGKDVEIADEYENYATAPSSPAEKLKHAETMDEVTASAVASSEKGKVDGRASASKFTEEAIVSTGGAAGLEEKEKGDGEDDGLDFWEG
ncbi:hypothetical protein RUND412_000407 [Rhizina undulata]